MPLSLKPSEKLLNATPKELRKFGIFSGIIITVLFGLFFPWLFSHGMPFWPWIVSCILIFWALLHPASLKIIHNPWVRIGTILGWVNSRIILSFVFYCIISPTGFLVRLFGKKLIKETKTAGESYRETPKKVDKKHMENPY